MSPVCAWPSPRLLMDYLVKTIGERFAGVKRNPAETQPPGSPPGFCSSAHAIGSRRRARIVYRVPHETRIDHPRLGPLAVLGAPAARHPPGGAPGRATP